VRGEQNRQLEKTSGPVQKRGGGRGTIRSVKREGEKHKAKRDNFEDCPGREKKERKLDKGEPKARRGYRGCRRMEEARWKEWGSILRK